MAVTSVKEDWQSLTASVSTDGASAPRKYTVVFDGTEDPQLRPMLACYASAGGVTIPRMWSMHPYSPCLYVNHINAFPMDGPLIYEVAVSYTVASSDQKEESPFMNPLDRPPEVTISFVAFNEQIDRDIYDNPIVNSAGQSFDPPPTEEFYYLVINIVRNEGGFDYLKAAAYIGSINNGSWWGFSPEMVKCARFGGRPMRAAAMTYWQVTYDFHIQLAEYAGVYYGWKKRIRDEGYAEKTGVDDDGKPVFKVIKDSDEVPVSQLVGLDGQGRILADGANAVFLTYDTKRKTNFSLLGL